LITPQDLKPHQLELMKAQKQYIHIDGGVGTYKSTACILRLYAHCFRYPGQSIMVLAQTYPQLMMVFMAEWKRQIPDSHYNYVGSPVKKITLPDCESEIILHHADHVNSEKVIRGASLSGWYIIQGETLRFVDVLDGLDQRIRLFGPDPNPGYLRLIDTNPGSPSHFIYKRFVDKQSEEYLGDDLIDYIHVETTPETSVYSARTIKQWERTLRPEKYRQMVKGEWCSLDGAIYDDYETTEPPKPEDIDMYFIGCDPGTALDTQKKEGNLALVWIGRHRVSKKYIVLEAIPVKYNGVGALAELIDKVCEYWGLGKLEAFIKDWAGGSGAVFSTELPPKSKYVDVLLKPAGKNPKYKQVAYGITAVYEALKTRKLLVSTGAGKVIRDIHSYSYNDKGDPDKAAYDSHLLDALRYAWIRISIFYAK